jgi:outer membrane cobalamin receptor
MRTVSVPADSLYLYHNDRMTQWAFALLFVLGQFSQTNMGELRLSVTDPAGLPVPGTVELISESNQLRQTIDTDAQGRATARRLPFGRYRLNVSRDGFAPFTALIDVHSALPADYPVVLALAAVQTQLTVSATDTLLDPRRTASSHRIGFDTLEQRTTPLPGRSLADLVNTQPGWLLEANGILHPRGSEYQAQYVVDGLPMTDNRSPSFAPEFGIDDVHALNILTGGYPAEYGRKLGGVIEVITTAQSRRGFGGAAAVAGGSFGSGGADALAHYGWERSSASVTASTSATDRYMDPPVEENFTNRGSTTSAAVQVEHDLTGSDRLAFAVRGGQSHFLVPNEHVQEAAGQRQDRNSAETAAQFSYQRIFSQRVLGDIRGMARDLSAGLWSNPSSTPIIAEQDRGFREAYLKGSVTVSLGAHEIKVGGDVSAGTVRERFAYRITDPEVFEPGTPAAFTFDERRPDREQALFIQDQMRYGAWTIYGGLRWDRYRLAVEDTALSPRVGVAWSWPAADLVLRGSFDRAFQTPAFENLLLASSDAVETLGDEVVRLPVPASRGNFYEAGLSKVLLGLFRVDVTHFSRQMSDVADDDVLLNTGVSFPVAFSRADVRGTEVKVDVPQWRKIGGSLSYSHLRGVGLMPVTGGLFLGEEAGELLQSDERFPLTQDQRHTVRGRVSYAFAPAGWVALAASYGSGLPFEDFSGDPDDAREQFGSRVVDRVDFETGRVLPNFSLDVSAGVILARRGRQTLRLQAEVRNLTDRLDVINFAGLFSGTALAAPRSAAVRLRAEF